MSVRQTLFSCTMMLACAPFVFGGSADQAPSTIPNARYPRPRISAITIQVVLPDGSTRTHTIDPSEVEAIAWSEKGVWALGQFYAPGGPAFGKRLTKEHVIKHFGSEAAEAVFGNVATDIQCTPDLVLKLWHTPEEDALLPAFISKTFVSNPTNGR